MSYINHFRHADDVIAHLDTIVPSIADPLLQIKYIGFVSVAAVTVYELAVKQIFIDFAYNKHKVLGSFIEGYFDRINGRIKIGIIQDEYIKKFGEKYKKRFRSKLDASSKKYLSAHHRDICASYNNLIIWRNDFAHAGKISSTTTYREVVQAYQDGKEIIHCLAGTMNR